jgi:hypothetical protein
MIVKKSDNGEEKSSPHILQIIIKNTSTFDYSIPLLWKIRKKFPHTRISVLYCVSNRKQIIRQAQFYDHFFKDNEIDQYDFGDFLKPPFHFLAPLWRLCFSSPSSDNYSIRWWLKTKNRMTYSGLRGLMQAIIIRCEKKGQQLGVNTDQILKKLVPDVILYDNRGITNFQGRDEFYKYFYQTHKPVVLLPHAPHYTYPTNEYCPFDEKGEAMPDFCEHWMPFQYGEPWLKALDKKNHFKKIGYPGLDKEWIEHLFTEQQRSSFKKDGIVRCLTMPRKFFPRNVKKAIDDDPFTLDYEETLEMLRNLKSSFDQCDAEFELIVKPHPYANYPETIALLEEVGFKRWSISHDPFYKLLPSVDCVISDFSTSLVLPVMYGIPTVVFGTKLQNYVHQSWDILRKLYTGLEFFTENPQDLPFTLSKILKKIHSPTKNSWEEEKDVQHLRTFFPDNALDKATHQLENLLNHEH